jgi:hypothetical protein
MEERMKRFGSLILAAALLAACLIPFGAQRTYAAPATRTHAAAPSHFFDKTRFVLHMGLAYYAFHHWVINVYKSGGFKSGSSHRVGNIVKAGIATLFAYHEVKTAYDIANKSSSKTLHALVAPLNALMGEANKVGTSLKKGNYSDSDVSALTNSVSSFGTDAAKAGYGIKDVPIKIPGL